MRFKYCLLAIICAFSVSYASAQIPWILPWNDATPSITDFSSYNGPIGTERVSADTNGHFVLGGERIRFLGVNFAGDSPFMPTNNADGVAARLAKYGVNNVRFHHMDASWAYGGGLLAYTSTKSTNFNAAQLDKLHFLISRLKAHGIYANINLLVGREYRSQDGLGPEISTIDWKDGHILGCFYPPAMELQKDFARKLLAPTNRFTGLPLAKDPAVAFVEILNENGMLQKWYEGALDRLPARYSTNLQARWNGWLRQRYGNSESAMLIGWGAVNEPLGTNHLRNGNFASGLTSWNQEQHVTAKAVFSRTYDFTNSGPSARIMVTNASTESWHIQFNQAGLALKSNQAYTVSFWAKASAPTSASVAVTRAHTDYAALGFSRDIALTTEWQLFTNTFQAPVNEANARVNFGGMGNKLVTFWYADVRFQAGGQVGMLPPGTSLAAGTVPNIQRSGSGYAGTRRAQRDWVHCLRELETAYYAEIVGYIRTNIGYTGLIFGTIMANSPASVQNTMDVIDGHSYWQHPNFPGQPWDSVNWYVQNISMVNTLGGDNTLGGLARQRIKGKPFTVTEYQHSSPNYYGAEGVLLLAAYGALQDWDGLWLFDYGHGNPAVTMGYVRGFFEIGQHPTKVPNLLLAANIFRRGDVSPGRQEYSMALTDDRELDLLTSGSSWNVFSSSQLGMPARRAFVNRVSTTLGTNGLTVAPGDPGSTDLTSDTGELRWNLTTAGKGLVTVNSRKTKALVGFADNKAVNLGGITVTPGTTRLGWCNIGITMKRGEVLTNDCSAIIVASGWWENTGQVWKDSTKNSVGNQWGTAPVLAEVVPFTLNLPVGTNHVRVWSLDVRGQRVASIPVTGSATSTTIQFSASASSLYYELEIGRWTASFDLWRLQNFSQQELADASISGPNAVSGPDGVPNLLKYHLGVSREQVTPAARLPRGLLLNQQYLAIAYEYDELTSDVTAMPEVSLDLASWLSGPEHAVLESRQDLGAFDRATFRATEPISSQPANHLRLRFVPN